MASVVKLRVMKIYNSIQVRPVCLVVINRFSGAAVSKPLTAKIKENKALTIFLLEASKY